MFEYFSREISKHRFFCYLVETIRSAHDAEHEETIVVDKILMTIAGVAFFLYACLWIGEVLERRHQRKCRPMCHATYLQHRL